MNRHHRSRRHALAVACRRFRAVRYDGETAVCRGCGTVYYKQDSHAC